MSPAHSQPFNPTSHLEVIGGCLKSQGFPDEVIELLLSAPRANTNAAYQSAWANWCDWCHRRDADPMSSGLKEVLRFLAGMFEEGKSYNTTNVHRCMLSSTLNLKASGLKDVGKHPLVVQLMKGIYQGKPPIPKYNATWDPSVVINHFVSTAGRTISLIQLARKTVTILALTTLTLLRCSELNSIQLDSVSFSATKVFFNLWVLRKSQRSGPLMRYSLDEWENPLICPVA